MLNIRIVTGSINSGKTTMVKKLLEEYRISGKTVAGVVTEADFVNNIKSVYNVVDISSGERKLLASTKPISTKLKFGRFFFLEEGFCFADTVIRKGIINDILVIDEIGPLELSGQGFFKVVLWLLENYNGTLLLVVRENLLEQVKTRLNLCRWELTVTYCSE